MPGNLVKLASFVPKVKMTHLESQFSMQKTASHVDLLKAKSVHPSTYTHTSDKFPEEKLPPKEFWENPLKNGEVTISDGDLEHANLVLQEFDTKALGSYRILQININVLILASIF